MQMIEVSTWNQFTGLVSAKSLFLQYVDGDNYYNLYAPEGNLLWYIRLIKGSEESNEFEDDYKATANQPLEYRSTDGLPKVASAKFADQKNLCLDGENACVSLSANSTEYMKRHFDFEFTLSGVDCRWYSSNFGDYIDFEVGFYMDVENEASFVSVSKFSNKYMVYGDGSRLFDVPSVKVIPVKVPNTDYDLYIRARCVNIGDNASKVILNLVGWR